MSYSLYLYRVKYKIVLIDGIVNSKIYMIIPITNRYVILFTNILVHRLTNGKLPRNRSFKVLFNVIKMTSDIINSPPSMKISKAMAMIHILIIRSAFFITSTGLSCNVSRLRLNSSINLNVNTPPNVTICLQANQ